MSPADKGRSILGRGHSTCKGREAAVSVQRCWRNSQEAWWLEHSERGVQEWGTGISCHSFLHSSPEHHPHLQTDLCIPFPFVQGWSLPPGPGPHLALPASSDASLKPESLSTHCSLFLQILPIPFHLTVHLFRSLHSLKSSLVPQAGSGAPWAPTVV